MHLISIIIPVYKAEKYIRKCLDSIKAQTHTHWEAILVDDGSPDGSGAICDKYAASDKRFKVIHQVNGGVSVARQTGLDNATGDYIIHCDPDDWVEPTMLEELLAKAIEEDADMVICDFLEERNRITTYTSQNITLPVTAKEIQHKIIIQELHGSCWNKLIKASKCKDIKFHPTNLSLGEDTLFNIRILNKEITVTYLPKAFYHYNLNNENSLTKNRTLSVVNSAISFIKEIEHIINKEDFPFLYSLKKDALIYALLAKQFKVLETLYSEIHTQAIEDGRRYNIFAPRKSCLSLALRGYPRTACYLYHINMFIVDIYYKIKNIFKHGDK